MIVTSSLVPHSTTEVKNGNKDDIVKGKEVAAVKCEIGTANKQYIALDLKFLDDLKGLINNISFRIMYLAVGCGRLIRGKFLSI